MPDFFELFWLVSKTCFLLYKFLWETFPLQMLAVTFGPAAIIVGSIMCYWGYKVRQIKKKYRDR